MCIEPGRLRCTRQGDTTTPLYHGRYIYIYIYIMKTRGSSAAHAVYSLVSYLKVYTSARKTVFKE